MSWKAIDLGANPFWEPKFTRAEIELLYLWDEYNEFGFGYGQIIQISTMKPIQ